MILIVAPLLSSCALWNKQAPKKAPGPQLANWQQALDAFCPSAQGKGRLVLPDQSRYSFSYESQLSSQRYIVALQSTWSSEVVVEINILPNGVSIKGKVDDNNQLGQQMKEFLFALGPFLSLLERHQQGENVCEKGRCRSYQLLQASFQGESVQLATDDYLLEGQLLVNNFFQKIIFRRKSGVPSARLELFPKICHSFPN